jgi:hypothetical protein
VGASPIYVASLEGHHESVQLLLEAGANVNSARENGATALYAAAQQGHARCLKLLLNDQANPNASIESGETALYIATKQGHKECVQVLVAAGCNVNVTVRDRTTGELTDELTAPSAAINPRPNIHKLVPDAFHTLLSTSSLARCFRRVCGLAQAAASRWCTSRGTSGDRRTLLATAGDPGGALEGYTVVDGCCSQAVKDHA